jgi:Fe-S-cluster containining protein
VLPEEKVKLESLGVPIVTVNGVYFIQRAEGGACPMLSKEGRRCTIYEERPICCRLYPIDLLNRKGAIEWALYEYCPIERKTEAVLVLNSGGRMDHGLLLQAIRMLEETFGAERIQYLAIEDLVASKIELLDNHRRDYSIVGSASARYQKSDSSAIC